VDLSHLYIFEIGRGITGLVCLAGLHDGEENPK
jgi:hypothetical protein